MYIHVTVEKVSAMLRVRNAGLMETRCLPAGFTWYGGEPKNNIIGVVGEDGDLLFNMGWRPHEFKDGHGLLIC